MKASRLEFRLRYVLHTLVFVLGFWAPWNMLTAIDPRGPNAHVWGILAANLSQLGVGSLLTSFNVLLVLAIACATAGAALRTWGTAYLGLGAVTSGNMQTAAAGKLPGLLPGVLPGVLTDGPYRYMRNPLYLGTFLHTLALALLMPRSGAIFSIVVIGLMQIRLILGEEAYLLATVGAPYTAYCSLVPRLLPALRAKVAGTGRHPAWVQAIVGEAYFWIVAISFAALGWSYNAARLTQGVIVAFGVALIARAASPRSRAL